MKREPLSLVAAGASSATRRPAGGASAGIGGGAAGRATGVAPGWRIALPALVLVLAFIVMAFFETAAGMAGIWARSETFAHGFVVAPISLWLIWRMRDQLRTLAPRPSWLALPLIAAAGFGWLLGEVGAVNALSQFAFVSMLVLAVPAILGIRITRTMLFPLGFLFFSVPIGEFLLPTLMAHTADFTIAAVRASGVPVLREGLQVFSVPNGRWSVVEACSGVRYLIASLVVGTLFAYLNYASMWRRVAFIGVSIAVPIVANWLRAYIIVMLGYLSDNRIATGVDHLIYGWLFFGLVMLIMFWIGSLWQQPAPAAPRVPAPNAGPDVATERNASPVTLWAAVFAVIAVAAAWPLAHGAIQRNAPDPSATIADVGVPGWDAAAAPAGSFTPHFLKPSAVRHEVLRRDGQVVGLYIAYYRGQNDDRKLVSSDNVLLRADDKVWHAIAGGAATMDIGGVAVPVVSARIRSIDGQMLEARQWYWIDGALTASDPIAKARVAWLRVTGRGDDSAVVALYTPAGEGTQPDATLQAFVRDAWPAIASALADAKGRKR
ncbi:MAG TPA: exosortase A [Casimicrobiaceae bacterium]|nr:exosortase A [Casimicrobiaceae bacterium]